MFSAALPMSLLPLKGGEGTCERVPLKASFLTAHSITQNRFHHLTVYIGQTEVAALKTVGQSCVIESQLLENCGLHIMHMDRIL